MKATFAAILAACVFAIGCENPNANKPAASTATPPATSATATPVPPPDVPEPADIKMPGETTPAQPGNGASAAAIPTAAPEGFTPVSLSGGMVQLTPENTTLRVIGTHAPPRAPDPRTIVFEKFTGTLTFDPITKLPKSANAEIDATSLVAFDPGLTTHLKSHDFIDVDAFSTIKFDSTHVEPAAEPGKVAIVGNLTLHGVTKEIKIPASITSGPDGTTVDGQITLNRRDFAIGQANIDNTVMPEMEFSILVGKKTERPAPAPPRRGRRGGG